MPRTTRSTTMQSASVVVELPRTASLVPSSASFASSAARDAASVAQTSSAALARCAAKQHQVYGYSSRASIYLVPNCILEPCHYYIYPFALVRLVDHFYIHARSPLICRVWTSN